MTSVAATRSPVAVKFGSRDRQVEEGMRGFTLKEGGGMVSEEARRWLPVGPTGGVFRTARQGRLVVSAS